MIDYPKTLSNKGKVFLIGAGPGDPELLTLKAVRALSQSDVVLLDDLVNRDVLQHCKPHIRVIEVGKRGGCKSTPQAFIERLMAQEALQGHVVARVKGGDPFVFGRGGEERAALLAQGIDVEVVHGITSGIAAAGAIGVPVTHRHHTRGVAFITAHTQDGVAVNWQALAQSGLTLVFYMGVKNVAEIQRELLNGGMSALMPAAIIQNACDVNQKSVVTTLCTLAACKAQHHLESPAIIVVGEVVREADELRQTVKQVLPSPASGMMRSVG